MTKVKINLSVLFAAAISLAVFGNSASAGELDARMAKIVKTFSRAASEAGVSTATLAVLPFQTDKKLAEKRVNYACAEILTNRFVEAKTFTMTERARLDDVMKEQALGLSGAVESATAARIGKVLGARLVILGSVSLLGSSYHLSTEMVDSETGEILASDVTEVSEEVFDKDASKYVVLVPDTQTISLYLLVGGPGQFKAKTLAPRILSGTLVTPSNRKTGSAGAGAGGGVRYFPLSRWLLDLSIMTFEVKNAGRGGVLTDPGLDGMANGTIYRLILSRQIPLTRHFNSYLGGGLAKIDLDAPEELYKVALISPVPNNISLVSGTARETLPLAYFGLEWRPQSRFGLTVGGAYLLGKPDDYKWVVKKNGQTETMTVWQLAWPKYTLEANLSVYF